MKKDLIAAAIYFVLVVAFFLPFIAGYYIFGFRDLSLYFYPLRNLMVEMVKSGQVPLWNPYIYCGIPFFATLQAGFLYPFSILFYVLPFDLGFNWFIILHYFLAGCFTYLLMRHYGLKRRAAFASGVIFSFSGYLLSVCTMNTTLTSVVWLPLVILIWDRFLGIERDERDEREEEGGGGNLKSKKSWDQIILPAPSFSLISVLSLMLLGGEPTIFYSTILIMVIYAFFQNKIKKILYLAPIIIFVFGLLAVQLIPFLEYVQNSVRVWRTELDFISHSSFPSREIMNFIIPNFWGNFLDGTYTDMIIGKDVQTWILSPYIGALPLFFACLALLKRSRIVWFYFLTAVFFLFLAFGSYTPVYKILFYALPGISAIRYPIKFLFFPTFAAAVLAGWGINDIEENIKPKMIAVFGSLLGLVFGSFILLKSFKPAIHQAISQSLRSSDYYKFILAKLLNSLQSEFMIISSIMAIAMILMVLFYKKMISGRLAAYGMILLIIFDLFIFNIGINPPISSSLFTAEKPNIGTVLKDRSVFRFYVDHRIGEGSGTYFKSQDDILFSLKAKMSPNLLVPYHLQDFYGRESIEPLRALRFYWAFREGFLNKRLDLLSFANVKYILSFKELNDPRLKMVNNKDYFLYQNLTVMPRAYISHTARTGGGSAKIIKYAPMSVNIEVFAGKAGKLILSDNYYPGWRAYLDGKETPIKRTDYLFRSVKVPKGGHKVDFVYDPLSVKIGAAISLLTLSLMIGTGLFIYFGRINAE